jgi:hypothetical protein
MRDSVGFEPEIIIIAKYLIEWNNKLDLSLAKKTIE